jgi:HEPN domain-containing protein
MTQDKIENIDKVIQSWIGSSNEDFDTMLDLYQAKRYSWALFLGHLSIEKLLKAYFIRVNMEHAP